MTEQKLSRANKIIAERGLVLASLRMLNGEEELYLATNDGRMAIKLTESARVILREEFNERSVQLQFEFENL